MKRIMAWGVLGLYALLGLSLPAYASTAVKTLERIHDPVIMEGRELKALLGSPIDRLALMALKGDKWAPIPFQIDQKKPDGSYAFSIGTGACKDPDPNLDANDELVYMVMDTGDRSVGSKWPDGAKKGLELEITDPKNGKKGWAYLIRFSGKAPRSKKDYVRLKLDKAGKYRMVTTYEYEMGGPTDLTFPDFMRTQTKADGRPGVDVADRVKIRGKIHLAAGLAIPFKMDAMSKAKDIGYIDGPVRVLNFSQNYLEFVKPIKIKIKGQSIVTYYANCLSWPLILDFPPSAMKFIKRVDVLTIFDFCPSIYGAFAFNSANPYNKKIFFNGKMNEAEKTLDRKTEITWNAGFGPEGALIHRLDFHPKGRVKLLTHYMDDETFRDPPEDCPGVTGIGYKIVGIENNPHLSASQFYYFLRTLKPEDIHHILNILDHPVKIRVKLIGI